MSISGLGIIFSKKGDHTSAIKCFLKAIELNYSDYFAHFYLAGEYKAINRYDFALTEYKKVLELSDSYSWAYFNIGQIYWEQGRVKEAIEMLKKTLEKNPKDADARKLLLKIYINKRDYNSGMDLITKTLKDEKNGDCYYLMGKIFEFCGDKNSYRDALILAISCKGSLTFDLNLVKKEYDNLVKELKIAALEAKNAQQKPKERA